jgi:hypothetical protein
VYQTGRETSPEGFAENRYRNYRFNQESIVENAPESSGIFGLYCSLWIYIGEGDEIRTRLLEHLNDESNVWKLHYRPCGFAFELVPPEKRGRRYLDLLYELQPLAQSHLWRKRNRGRIETLVLSEPLARRLKQSVHAPVGV